VEKVERVLEGLAAQLATTGLLLLFRGGLILDCLLFWSVELDVLAAVVDATPRAEGSFVRLSEVGIVLEVAEILGDVARVCVSQRLRLRLCEGCLSVELSAVLVAWGPRDDQCRRRREG
jgi:hypothetical protein